MAEFKDRINEALEIRKMKAADLAKLSGVNEGAISQYRIGAYEATQRTLDKLSKALNVSVPWLMGYDVPMDRAQTFGDILGNLRRNRVVSLNEISEATGISRTSLTMYETDRIKPTSDALVAIADYFGVSLDYLHGRATADTLTPHEQTVITQYRAKPHLQEAVDKLLDVPPQIENPLDYGSIAALGGELNRAGKKKVKTTLHNAESPLPDEIQKDIARELEHITGTAAKKSTASK